MSKNCYAMKQDGFPNSGEVHSCPCDCNEYNIILQGNITPEGRVLGGYCKHCGHWKEAIR